MIRVRSVRGGVGTLAGVVVLSFAVSGATLAASSARDAGASLAKIRQATVAYQDLNAALAAGYIPVSPCVEAPGIGGMGFHYLNPGLAADLAINPLTPEILIYAPSGNGLRLVAVEYFMVALANTENGPAPWFGTTSPPLGFFNPAPSVMNRTFNGPMAGHDPRMPWHYDLHAWIWQGNPAGTFQQFNPNVAC